MFGAACFIGTTGVGALRNRCCFIGVEKENRRFYSAVHVLAREVVKQIRIDEGTHVSTGTPKKK